MLVKSKPAEKDNFNKYGSVVKLSGSEPTSQDPTYKFWSNLVDYYIDGRTEIGICSVYKQNSCEITGVERHLKTPEILIPIDAPFIVPLLAEGEPENNLEAFRVDIGEAVIIKEGIWHGACLPVAKKESSYFVIFKLNTPKEDVFKKEISRIQIEF